jgi:hypothetical protein
MRPLSGEERYPASINNDGTPVASRQSTRIVRAIKEGKNRFN